MFLGKLFAQTEQSLNAVVEQAVKETQHEQDTKDAKALATVYGQLTPEPGVKPPTQEQLNTAVSEASQFVRIQVFQRASDQRRANWRTPTTKTKMELTIPVFRALIAADPDERFHRNHGQLGYALKDRVAPDYVAAEQELTKAITIRDRQKRKGSLLYEFNRALCRIKLNRPREEIRADLEKAAGSESLRQAITGDPDIAQWMRANNLTGREIFQGN